MIFIIELINGNYAGYEIYDVYDFDSLKEGKPYKNMIISNIKIHEHDEYETIVCILELSVEKEGD